jgi:hypothetical protein
MSRFVSSTQERGHVNYEELVKFLAKCLGDTNYKPKLSQQPQSNIPPQQPSYNVNKPAVEQSSRIDVGERYDPDEQAILRLMHENMRDWDQINLIDCDNLRKKFYEIDPYNRYILTQREVNIF